MKIHFVLSLLFFFSAIALAQNQEGTPATEEDLNPEFYEGQRISSNLEIPEGMEEVQIGGSGKLVVPQGAKTRKVGAQVIVEGTKEYMARRFKETDERLKALEDQQTQILKEIEELKKSPRPETKSGLIK